MVCTDMLYDVAKSIYVLLISRAIYAKSLFYHGAYNRSECAELAISVRLEIINK